MTYNVVAFGGGHGLYSTLRALTLLKQEGKVPLSITAVVGVSDDGGSSGQLRDVYPVVPPGDLRMACAALCPPSDQGQGVSIEQVLQFRFPDAPASGLAGHVVGNIVLTALWSMGLSTTDGLTRLGSLLNLQGQVLPASTEPTVISALITNESSEGSESPHRVVGQVAVAQTSGTVVELFLEPADPEVGYEVIDAINSADLLVFGPGSWFTSVIPHLLIPRIRSAISRSNALRILILNLVPGHGETARYTPSDYLDSWRTSAPEIGLDYVIADSAHDSDIDQCEYSAQQAGATVIWDSLAQSTHVHDPHKLAAVLDKVRGMRRGTTWP